MFQRSSHSGCCIAWFIHCSSLSGMCTHVLSLLWGIRFCLEVGHIAVVLVTSYWGYTECSPPVVDVSAFVTEPIPFRFLSNFSILPRPVPTGVWSTVATHSTWMWLSSLALGDRALSLWRRWPSWWWIDFHGWYVSCLLVRWALSPLLDGVFPQSSFRHSLSVWWSCKVWLLSCHLQSYFLYWRNLPCLTVRVFHFRRQLNKRSYTIFRGSLLYTCFMMASCQFVLMRLHKCCSREVGKLSVSSLCSRFLRRRRFFSCVSLDNSCRDTYVVRAQLSPLWWHVS